MTGVATRPIGVFDSGVGGLSVLRALHAELPLENFFYVADNGHAPYGERDDRHVIARSHAIARYLVKHQHIKALVVACNTATAAAIASLRHDFATLPIVGIEPALKPATAHSQTGQIGVMATRGTLNSQKFQTLLRSLQTEAKTQAQTRFVLQACDGLADAIEHADTAKIVATCAQYTSAMGRFGMESGSIDTLVLGCTHYAFATDVLRSLVGEGVQFLEGGAPVARQTRRLLEQHGWLAPPAHTGTFQHAPTQFATTFATTGDAGVLRSALQSWLHVHAPVQVLAIT